MEITRMRRTLRFVVPMLLVAAAPAWAWGPRAETAIVTSAAQLLAKEAVLQIERIESNLRDGALMTSLQMEQLYPDFAVNPILAIENEMLLLQSLRTSQIDGYYAYRLGALGKLVANVTAPLAQTDPTYANLYYKDAESNIGSASLQRQPAQVVDPRAYFQRRLAESSVNTDVIVREYKNGVGFKGVAGQTLEEAASRSLASVADVWRTILAAPSVESGISDQQLRDYVVSAYGYYIGRGNASEIASADRRLEEMVEPDPDTIVRVADLFYDAGLREDAVKRYERALAAMPERRDVVGKIAEYYMELGEEALGEKKLEDAMASFEAALKADPLHATAEGRRIEAATLIEEREYRLATARMAIEEAAGFELLAEQEVLNGRIAEAVALLHEAQNAYSEVDDEFPLEYQKASTGARTITNRLEALRGDLMANSQLLSGSGFSTDAPRMAREAGRSMDEATLKAMISDALTSLEQQLQADAENLLRIQ
jgi:tetratricopeptide (TPR) repeat protein